MWFAVDSCLDVRDRSKQFRRNLLSAKLMKRPEISVDSVSGKMTSVYQSFSLFLCTSPPFPVIPENLPCPLPSALILSGQVERPNLSPGKQVPESG